MIDIQPLSHFGRARFGAIASGYTTTAVYQVSHEDGDAGASLRLTLLPLPGPRAFRFPFDEAELQRYDALVPGPFTLGAFDGPTLAGIALGEAQAWNGSLWVWEFHIAAEYQRRGIGRRLMDALAERGRAAGLRTLVCETQNTNVPAIRFYRAAGLVVEGIDISYYTNDDLGPDGTVAVFMKRRLP